MEKVLLPLLGGILIGTSSSIILYTLGRITGISGILSVVFNPKIQSNHWKISFFMGLIGGGFLLRVVSPDLFDYSIGKSESLITILSAGFLVGLGTRLGNGCTSGHGVCGLPRLSPRSIIATLTFMAVAILTVIAKKMVVAL